MPNDPTSDLDVEQNVVFEYSQAMAAAAESGLRYPDRMQSARSDAERAFIRESYVRLVEKTIDAHKIAFAAMTLNPYQPKGNTMNWLYKSLMAVAIVGGSLVTAGILPVAFAGVATAVGIAGGYFHVTESQSTSGK